MTDLNKTGTFAATTDGNYNTIPYYRAKSFRVTNFTGKVVGIRQRHHAEIVDNFNDTNFSEWTGDIAYESSELEGSGAARVRGTAYRTLTNQVMLDGSEVEFFILMPITSTYSFKIGVYDDPSRIGMDGAGFITLNESNSKSNTKLKVTIRLRPSVSKFDVFLENPDIAMDRIHQVVDADGVFGANNMDNSIVAIEAPNLVIDPIIYRKKVNHTVEHIGHGGSYTYPCENNTSEYEIINLGSDAMNYSDNTQTISISGFYAR